jgi:5-formyltetrahydrofolate cyclo-ligase
MNKKEVREIYIAKRKNLERTEKDAIDHSLFNLFISYIETKINSWKALHIYLPIDRMNEINTWRMLDYLFENKPDLKIYTSIVDGDDLVHRQITKATEYEMDKWGIPIPKVQEQVVIEEPIVVVVPLLACDYRGYRVGYGKGFYDKFLSSCKPGSYFVGLSQFEPIENFDQDPWDVPLNVIVTPSKVYEIKKA